MITGNFKCVLCGEEYKPTKRGRQIYCSPQCRKKASYHRNKGKKATPSLPKSNEGFTKKEEIIPLSATEVIPQVEQPKSENKFSATRVTEAALGSLLADGTKAAAKYMLRSKEKQPAIKKHTNELKKIGRASCRERV